MPALFITALGLLLVGWFIGQPWWQRRRRLRLRRTPMPLAWRRLLRQQVPLYRRLPTDLQRQLRGHVQVFLANTRIFGCQGLEVSDEMRLSVAAHAALLLLNQPDGHYPGLRQVLLYPDSFVVQRDHTDAVGVAHQTRAVLAGESWSQGQVVLSWADTQHGARLCDDGQNVAIHEFAHQLDAQTGQTNGAPALAPGMSRQQWAAVLGDEFRTLQARVTRGAPALLCDYAATDPAEFFAVASEVFFEQPRQMLEQHPALYQQLRLLYRIDPQCWADIETALGPATGPGG